ncbi:hypothetical protein ACTTAL_06435 [Rhodobacter capsulatus]|uniref:hypothetical protein n=1 Tax=Rhodobacter capsulatus TaxID=1061 RepID=UPI0003D3347C|nr:hypothetical protein [Rhodobacter capsulatus]ETD90210.1 hypothetical protein U713_06210 [Rhodobacter capsulatus YW2]
MSPSSPLQNQATRSKAFDDGQEAAKNAWEAAQDFKKSEEAIKFAVREENWNVPRYIREGLIWLSEPPPPLVVPDGEPEEPAA